jgi:integrase
MQFYCFLRPGAELRHVTVGDVDLDRKLIRVSAETAKNGRFEYVKIPRPLQEYLLGMNLEDYPSTFFLIGTDGRPSEQIIYENYLGEHFRQVRAALKFPDKYKFYSFKHSGAINFMMNGGNVLSLMRQLRHKSLNTTEVYLRSIGVEEVVGLETMFSAI